MVEIQETPLPGVGQKYTLRLGEGGRLVIVLHHDGKRDLYHFPEDESEEPCDVYALSDDEARQIGAILGGAFFKPKVVEDIEVVLGELVIEWFRISEADTAAGKTLGELQLRQQTGASVIAIIRDGAKSLPNPGPDAIISASDTLVALGTRAQLDELQGLLTRT
jgi:TrkA domain protein